ncbi:MAG: hypothetical protein JW807_16835 [Spirochaetes bacterium]|nr:hypothetical protein [Spirochaetota bacterium]
MNIEINKFFLKVITNSLETAQMNFLGEKIDSSFNVYSESGFHSNMPLPRRVAAEVLIRYFKDEEDIVRLFTIMLHNEGARFYNATLHIWGRDEFIRLLKRYKWIFDPYLIRFFLDPFYEHEINFLKEVRVIDLRSNNEIKNIIKGIEKISSKMGIKDLEWRITLRLYDLEPDTGELIRKILGLLLARQNLQDFSGELYVCLKELAINASKANYKILFDRHVTRKQGVTPDKDYIHFLRLFKSEIEHNGNKRLFELAKIKDKYITIIFQSTIDTIGVWVTNSDNISLIEKQQILNKIGKSEVQFYKSTSPFDEEYAEGAGFGLTLILSVLRNYSRDEEPLKVVFYPDFIKIGFILHRSELKKKDEAAGGQEKTE